MLPWAFSCSLWIDTPSAYHFALTLQDLEITAALPFTAQGSWQHVLPAHAVFYFYSLISTCFPNPLLGVLHRGSEATKTPSGKRRTEAECVGGKPPMGHCQLCAIVWLFFSFLFTFFFFFPSARRWSLGEKRLGLDWFSFACAHTHARDKAKWLWAGLPQ